MSDAWENILENIDEHIDDYFNGEHEAELINFIFTNDKAKEMLWEMIAQSPLGEKIAQKAYEDLPDKSDYLADLDRDR